MTDGFALARDKLNGAAYVVDAGLSVALVMIPYAAESAGPVPVESHGSVHSMRSDRWIPTTQP